MAKKQSVTNESGLKNTNFLPKETQIKGFAKYFYGLRRLIHYRLMIPLLRYRGDPKHIARGMLIGLAVAMTPSFGVQMLLVTMIWLLQKAWFRGWHFSVLVAYAWTWLTNIFTIPIFYYMFLLTGNFIMGNSQNLHDYNEFYEHIQNLLSADKGFWYDIWFKSLFLFRQWGIPIFIGSIPWVIIASGLGYYYGLRFMERLARKRMAKKRMAKQ